MNPVELGRCSLTELRRRPSSCIARARDSQRPLLITRRGKAIAVLMTLEQYELQNREAEELDNFVRSAATSTFARFDTDEEAANDDPLRGSLKRANVDEDDYRRYLEEKHL
ncbi:MAG: hypothetical protein CVT67_11865 [Actinobacteria bacterium HGW-Actinobacteria-7]|jgi:prevent-host-death family protein|nr:MAG: hypothetical protein CVT67_11865 [Actinobacteria bacterium HGW-Actinobacteria-7]